MRDPELLPTWVLLLVMLAITIVIAAIINTIEVLDPGVEWNPPTTTNGAMP